LIKRIRNKFCNPSITTDIMVGFAGENEEDFIESLRFANKIKFAKSHVFAYSRREGTLAYDMPGQISNTLKEERSHRMIAATLASEYDFCSSQIGQKVHVLFESFDGEFYEGYSENHTHVKVKFNRNIISEIFDVKITDCKNSVCIGEIIDEEAVTYE
ncbi:MAG: tRNA (N(6)-L-threonylcarbamoyladenosine(37)-C(2))-methylthiotransferase MtaB, partial [Oscillospiraceae bacterium]